MKIQLASAMLSIVCTVSTLASTGSEFPLKPLLPSTTQDMNSGKKLTIYSYNEEFYDLMNGYAPSGVKLDYVVEHFASDYYDGGLDDALNNRTGEDVVDIYIIEPNYAAKYLTPQTALPLSKLGITEADCTEMFQFNIESCKNEAGELSALSVINSPGVFMYRRSAAKAIFGTDDPAEVQKHISDWDKYLDSAKLAKEKGYYMSANFTDMFLPFAGTESFIDENGAVSPGKNAQKWAETAKTMYQNGYCRDYTTWSERWSNGFTEPDIFGWFTANWFVEFTLDIFSDETDWAICQGPASYCWGGSYAIVNPKTDNAAAAAELLRHTCIEGNLSSSYDRVIPNNRSVLSNTPAYTLPQLSGQNPLPVYQQVLESMDVSHAANQYDYDISSIYTMSMTEYIIGDLSKKEALNMFYDCVYERYPQLKK